MTSLVSPWPVKAWAHKVMLASASAMCHDHVWQKEPPEGERFSKRPSDERHGDKLDVAHNSYWSSPEELQRLRFLLVEDPEFENSSDWPMVVEWCSSCAITRVVKLVLPEEEVKVVEPAVEVEEKTALDEEEERSDSSARDACTQTPRQKPRRRGGLGSRTRRMLAYQLMLTAKRGLPLSRLLCQQETDARSFGAGLLKLQEESASPQLKAERMEVKLEKKQGELDMHNVKEEKEARSCPREEVSTGESTIFTPRSSQTGANSPISQPLPHGPFPALSPPLFTPPFIPLLQTPQFGQMPAANWVFCGGCQTWGTVIPICVFQ